MTKRRPPLSAAELAWILNTMAGDMAHIATLMRQYNGDPQWKLHARELAGAAKIARGWVKQARREAKQ